MKYCLSVFLAFLSLQTFACPDMDGFYECRAGSRVSLKEVVSTAGGFLIISDGAEREYFIDDQFREIPSTNSFKDALYKSRCTNDFFIVDFKATLLYEGAEVGKQIQTSTYTMSGNELLIVQKTKAKGIPLPTVKYICKK